jgi:N-acetylglucosaminyl-diphospho-decaprenol L-rhamnosyltransferase
MDLSIVVVSYNTHALLERCLSAVSASARGLQHEIVVVDNASDDGSPDLVETAFPDAIVIRNADNRGFAAAVNQGVLASSGRYVLLLNSDATVDADTVPALLGRLDQTPRAAAAGGMLLHPDGTFQGSYADFPTLTSETLLATGLSRWLLPPTFPSYPADSSQDLRTVDWVCGALVMLRRAALDDVGPFDEAFFMYAEEVDWCYRARQRGWSILYVPEARALHHVGASYGRAPVRRRKQIYRSKWLYFRKHRGWPQATAFLVAVQAASIIKLAGWAVASLGARGPQRDRARGNVASYRYLLSSS